MHLDYSLLVSFSIPPSFFKKEKELTGYCEEILKMLDFIDFSGILWQEIFIRSPKEA